MAITFGELMAQRMAQPVTTGALPVVAPVTTGGVQLPANLMGGVASGSLPTAATTAAAPVGGLTFAAPPVTSMGPVAPAGVEKTNLPTSPLSVSSVPVQTSPAFNYAPTTSMGPFAPATVEQPTAPVSPITFNPTETAGPSLAEQRAALNLNAATAGATTGGAPTSTEIEKLYQETLGRSGSQDTAGMEYWTNKFGPTIDDAERAEFIAAAAPEKAAQAKYPEIKTQFDTYKNNPYAMYQYAVDNNLTQDQIAAATGMTADQVKSYFDPIFAPIAEAVDISKDPTTGKTQFGTGGQYGYVDGVAVLNANVLEGLFDEQEKMASMGGGMSPSNSLNANVIRGDLKGQDNPLGWALDSYSSKIARGLDALNVTYDQPGAMGQPGTKGNIWDLAANAGVDPKDFYKTTTGQYGVKQTAFDEEAFKAAVNDKYKDVYAVTGLVEKGENKAFDPSVQQQATGNHATVLYKQVGDKLIPISPPTFFNAQREGKGALGDIGELAKVALPIAMMIIPGANLWALKLGQAMGLTETAAVMAGSAAINAGMTAITGGSASDILKSGAIGAASAGLSYNASTVAGNLLGNGDIGLGFDRINAFANATGLSFKQVSDAVANATAGAISAGVIGGQNVSTVFATTLAASTIGSKAGNLVDDFTSDINPGMWSKVSNAASNVASSTASAIVQGADPSTAAGEALLASAGEEFKSKIKSNTKTAEADTGLSAEELAAAQGSGEENPYLGKKFGSDLAAADTGTVTDIGAGQNVPETDDKGKVIRYSKDNEGNLYLDPNADKTAYYDSTGGMHLNISGGADFSAGYDPETLEPITRTETAIEDNPGFLDRFNSLYSVGTPDPSGVKESVFGGSGAAGSLTEGFSILAKDDAKKTATIEWVDSVIIEAEKNPDTPKKDVETLKEIKKQLQRIPEAAKDKAKTETSYESDLARIKADAEYQDTLDRMKAEADKDTAAKADVTGGTEAEDAIAKIIGGGTESKDAISKIIDDAAAEKANKTVTGGGDATTTSITAGKDAGGTEGEAAGGKGQITAGTDTDKEAEGTTGGLLGGYDANKAVTETSIAAGTGTTGVGTTDAGTTGTATGKGTKNLPTNDANINKVYQAFLGRQGDKDGIKYWKEKFGEDISPSELMEFVAAGQKEKAGKGTSSVTGGTGNDTIDGGKGTDGKGTDGKGTDGKGTDGKGTDGTGTDGTGTDGKGTDGKGTDGTGTDGTGTDGKGTDGTGTDGTGTDGKGTGDGGGGGGNLLAAAGKPYTPTKPEYLPGAEFSFKTTPNKPPLNPLLFSLAGIPAASTPAQQDLYTTLGTTVFNPQAQAATMAAAKAVQAQAPEPQSDLQAFFDEEERKRREAEWEYDNGEELEGFAAGGQVPSHPAGEPEFYSQGGLGTMYVQGRGDGTSDSVPAMLANNEFVIPADVVAALGNGSSEAGAGVLEKFMIEIRKHKQSHDPSQLPPSSAGPLEYLAQATKKGRK